MSSADEGYRAPRCTCGHPVGEHKSSRSAGLHASRYGICLAEGCGCTEFVEVKADQLPCQHCGGREWHKRHCPVFVRKREAA